MKYQLTTNSQVALTIMLVDHGYLSILNYVPLIAGSFTTKVMVKYWMIVPIRIMFNLLL